MKYHPDVAQDDPTAGEKFKEITEAYSLLKKHQEKVDELTQPAQSEDTEFVSKRPPPPSESADYRPPFETKEYINFKPLKIKLPENDRLGINYKPFFDDKDATHPKAGTMAIMICCLSVVGLISTMFLDLEERDYQVNELLYQRLIRKYTSREWDKTKIFPALQVFQQDPEYQDYVRVHKEDEQRAKYETFVQGQETLDRFSIYQAEQKTQ